MNILVRNKSVIAFCLIILNLALSASVLAASTENADKANNQELTVTYPTDIMANKIDAASYDGAITVYPMIYDSLVNYGEGGEILPGLAQSWDVEENNGKMEIIFHLREGIVFSDGTPFNANAVKFTLDRARYLNPKDKTSMIKNLETVDVLDEHTVKLVYDTYLYPILKQLTFPRPVRIMSPTAVSPEGDPEGDFIKPIGTGMWTLDEYVQDQYAVFKKNPNYWGKMPTIEKVTFKVIPDAQTRSLALQSGDVDMTGGSFGRILPETLPVLEGKGDLAIERELATMTYYLLFRYNKYPFNDTNVRKAINYAIDKDNMVSMVGIGEPAKGFFASTVDYVTDENSYNYPYDIDEAKRLLEEAGWKDSDGDGILDKDGQAFEAKLIYQVVDYPEWGRMCELIQEDLRKVGIKVELVKLESAAYYDRLWTSRDFDLLIYRTYTSQWNPEGMISGHFVYPSQVGDNDAVTYSDPVLNELVNEVLTIRSEDERQKVYDQIFKQMYDQAACVPLYYCENIYAMKSCVKGFVFGTNDYEPIKWEELWISN